MGPQLQTVDQPRPPTSTEHSDDDRRSLYLATIYVVCAHTVLIRAESKASAHAEARRMWADDIRSDEPDWRDIDWVDVQPA